MPISDYIKNYCLENNIVFSDFDCATIISCSRMEREEKNAALREIAERTDDEPLRTNILAGFAWEDATLAQFRNNESGKYIYKVDKSDSLSEWSACFYSDFDEAHRRGCTLGEEFQIEKFPLSPDAQLRIPNPLKYNPIFPLPKSYVPIIEYSGGAVAKLYYRPDGTLRLISYNDELEQESFGYDPWFLGNHFFVPPNPFERGDIVRMGDKLGIVEESQERWRQFIAQVGEEHLTVDYYDAGVTVEFPQDDGKFMHSHVSPLLLEPVTDWEDKELLEIVLCASELMKGELHLDFFLNLYYEEWTETVRERNKGKGEP